MLSAGSKLMLTRTRWANDARQNAKLRSASATAEWELDMIRGRMYRCEQLSMIQTSATKFFPQCGIESSWPECRLCQDDPRIVLNDSFCLSMVDLVFHVVIEHVRRNLTLSHGYPRREVMMLAGDLQAQFIEEFRNDLLLFQKLKDCTFSGCDIMVRRSQFQKTSVKQLELCLQKCEWNVNDERFTVRL